MPLDYKGKLIEVGFRADIVIKQKLLIELKAVEQIIPVHKAQVITYPTPSGAPSSFSKAPA